MDRFLRAVGRILLTILTEVTSFFWNIIKEIGRGIGKGLSKTAQKIIPWAVGGGIFLFILRYHPEILNLILVILIMVFGAKILYKKLLGKK